jgi:beta-phosphoglucomutase
MKLAIFDLDGVVVSTDSLHYKAWKELAVKYHLTFNEKINAHLRGVSRAESLRIILELNGRNISSDEFETMLFEKNEVYKELLNELDSTWILPGVNELLENLKENNVLIAIGSSSRNTPKILEKIGLTDCWDTIVDGNQISKSKPDPEVFMKGADLLEIDYKDCVVFEDAQAGVDAANNAEMKVVGVGHEPLENTDWHSTTLEGVTVQTIIENIKGENK